MPRLEQHLRHEHVQQLQQKLLSTVTLRQDLIAERDALIDQIGRLSDEIGQQLALADEKSVRVGQYQVTLMENQGRLTLDKHRLVELGVSADTIIAASVRGAGSTSLQVRRVPDSQG